MRPERLARIFASLVATAWIGACGEAGGAVSTEPGSSSGGASEEEGSGGEAGSTGSSATASSTTGSTADSGGSSSDGTEGGGSDGGTTGEPPDDSMPDGPTGHAFDERTGRLNVRTAEYMAKHDIVYQLANSDPIRGLTVGNGQVGAIVWNENGLTMQVSGVDASEQAAFGVGRVNFSTTPQLDAEAEGFEQRLSPYDGTLVTRYGPGLAVTILGAAESEILGIHVEDDRPDVTAIELELSLWDVSNIGNSGAAGGFESWRTPSSFAEAEVAGLSRGQGDPDGFGYTMAATVEGAAFTTEALADDRVRLSITPSPTYTIWIVAASRYDAPGHDSPAEARRALQEVRTTGFGATQAAYEDFWHGFWDRSFLQFSDESGAADYFESVYALSTSMIAAGGYGTHPFHFINGVFRATEDATKWSNAYWYWNQRDVYHSFLASNHADMTAVFNRMYSRAFDRLKDFTMTRYGVDGIWVPETMGWNGNADGTVGSDFTDDILSTGAEAAMNMLAQYAYTGDEAYLRDTAYPFMKEVVKFYQQMLSQSGSQYYVETSNAHETYWDVQNAITDLAAVRMLFPATIAVGEQLGLDADLHDAWQEILDNLVPFPDDGTRYLPHDPPDAQVRNGENVACEIVWPYDLTGIGAPDHAMAVQTWRDRPFPYGNVWANDAIQAARLGLGDDAFAGLRVMLQKYQSYENGMTNNDNGVFEYLGVHLVAVNESLLHSHGDRIRVFPALPDDETFVARFTLAARGGFLVSSEREAGEIKYVGVLSNLGNPATVIHPWPGEEARVRRSSDGTVLWTGTDEAIAFDTDADTVYVIERTAKPLSSYTYSHITAERNDDAKYLPDSSCQLGISIGGPPDTGKYEAENATLVDCNASTDPAASGSAEVINLKEGSSIGFENVLGGTELDVRYCTFNDPGRLDLYVDGVHDQEVVFPSTESWDTTYETLTLAVTVPAGSTLELRYDPGGAGANIDYVQLR